MKYNRKKPKILKRVGLTKAQETIMKKYQKAEIIAKNLPSGSYAAGCPAQGCGGHCDGFWWDASPCKRCERTK